MKLFIILFLISFEVFGQSNLGKTLTFDAFIARVKTQHPLAKQADLKLNQGDAYVRKARGNFDPKAFSDASQKYFSDKQYYSIINSGLKVPTWCGIEVNGGYSVNEGVFLNPQNNTPNAGLFYAGLSVNVGKGLFIDERRAELKKAKIYEESTEAERALLYNELLYNAGKAYWNWFESYNKLKVYESVYEVTLERLNAVKQSVLLGDKPAIDSTEASIQLQNRQLSLQQAQLNYKNNTALLSIYLWEDGNVPLEISENTTPPNTNEVLSVGITNELETALDSLSYTHPLLKQYNYKIQQLKIDKKWQQEQLKPDLTLKYNALNQPVGNDAFANYNSNNYTWGLSFSIPLFLRKERGNLQLAKLKVNEAELEYSSKQASITYKAIASLNDLENTQQQITLYARTVQDYAKLLDGEKQMFNAGESSLFMVNSREVGFIDTQLKYINLLTKNQKSKLACNYAFGLLIAEK